MAKDDIVPGPDPEFDAFQNKVVTQSTTNKVAWNIPDAELDVLTGPRADWNTAWGDANDADTVNHVLNLAKNQMRGIYEPLLRKFIQKNIRRNPAIPDAGLGAMGIKLIDTTKTAAPVPTETVELSTEPMKAQRMKVIIGYVPDGEDDIKSGKPDKVVRTELAYAFVENNNPVPMADLNFRVFTTKTKVVVEFSEVDSGKLVAMQGRFLNSRDQAGPHSQQIRFRVP